MTTTDEHFDTTDGTLSPQPWMQLRRVATSHTDAVARTYGATGGQNKDEVYQTLSVTWTNNTPMVQYVYGLVHQGGCAVSLQVRSRGYIRVSHGLSAALVPKADPTSGLVEVSRFGGGADIGVGGLLGIGTDFGMHELRFHSNTVPLMPHLTGWLAVSPGHTVTGAVETRFVSENWESTNVTNGKENTDCTVVSGELSIDLFAVPVIEPPRPRTTPVIIGKTIGLENSKPVTVAKPAGTQPGDILLAICGNNFGNPADLTAPAGWLKLHTVNDNGLDWFNSHVKVFVHQATNSEPASYTFGNNFGTELVVQMICLRGAVMPSTAADSDGWAVGSTRKRWSKTGNMHVAPSMATNGQLLICTSFMGLTDNPFDGTFGTVPVVQNPPAGMTSMQGINGASSTMLTATLNNPPNPTQERVFTTEPRAYFNGDAVTLAILVAGTQQF